jgi:hypothetical protein
MASTCLNFAEKADCDKPPYPNTVFCARGCTKMMQADNICQPECNVASCGYDNRICIQQIFRNSL